ncbi:MAG: DUF1553 domain-containing protein [Verrucomicrobiaceae bacterium]|nr:DUF1553 domain-containing protein [Verrucomicrobiaceae bacterium]
MKLGRSILLLINLTAAQAAVEYNRDVRPILSDKCFKCHGFDAHNRKANLRLDVREEALKPAKSGEIPIVPRDATKSEVILRITTSDDDDVMPPGKNHERLKEREIAILNQWINEGAEYQAHWAFVPPVSQEQRAKSGEKATKERGTSLRSTPFALSANPIDTIVRSRLAKEGLKPSPLADDATLRRRVSLAVTGLPSSSFDIPHSSFESFVDSLLASPHFGERLAIEWLDTARYADTNGYYTDGERQAWPWRDWVIKAFNANMPFDRFTIEQLAGDLLPNATLDQKIATAFNRNHTVTNETGIIDEEYRTSYVCDRVETTAATWLGLTMGCAKCHDHKYDPLTMRDYYGLFAAFNNVPETGIVKDVTPLSPAPSVSLPTREQEQQIAELSKKRESLEAKFKAHAPALHSDIAAWEKRALDALPPLPLKGSLAHFDFERDTLDHGPLHLKSTSTGKITHDAGTKGKAMKFDATQYIEFADPQPMERDRAFTLSVWINPGSSPQGCVASKQDSGAEARGFEILWYKAQPRINLAHRYGSDGIEVVAKDKFANGQWRHLVVTYDGSSKAAGLKVYVDGTLSEVTVRRDSLTGSIASKEPWRIAWKGSGIGFEGGVDEFRLFDHTLSADEISALHWREFLEGTLAIDSRKRTKAQTEKLESYFIAHHGSEELQQLSTQLAEAKSSEDAAKKQIISVSVMQDMPKPRETHVLTRGQYDQPGESVGFAVPASLGKLTTDAPRNRLGLAQWLVSKDNPLTARVAVNRLWTMCFGDGLVRTPNDFGLQGELPTNPELLDFLAVRFRDGDATTKPWDIKALLKLIVTSETFRQSSNFTPELLARDPDNRLLARGPRFRLPAEVIRDQAFAISGLLVPTIGGPSVKPYQPPGLWEAVSYNGEATYQPDTGDATHRRGLYTFWKRQSPPPDMLTFDGPTREVCTIRRPRTNTPLQALLLLNDENYQEAARSVAIRVMGHEGHRASFVWRLVTGRDPKPSEVAEIESLRQAQLDRLRRDPPHTGHRAQSDDAELAAWTMVASLLLNLDEVQVLH